VSIVSRSIRILMLGCFMAVLAIVLTASPALAASCSASGIFSSCSAHCDPGETPVCTTGFLGLSVHCTCLKNGTPRLGAMNLSVESSQEVAFGGYLDLLDSLGSAEAAATAAAAEAMQAAARADDVESYLRAAAKHDEAVAAMSDEELEAIEDWSDGARPVPVD
jgi:hypothetical protein